MAIKKKVQEEKAAAKGNKLVESFKENRVILAIIIGIVALVVISLVITDSLKHFKYNGVEFEKSNYGTIKFYTAKIPVQDYFGKVLEYRTINFRNDPRQLGNMVSMNNNLSVKFLDAYTTYLSFKSDKVNCENYGLATANLAIFLRSDIKIPFKQALANKTEADEKNVSFVNCDTNPLNTVIYLYEGNETKITKTGPSCYNLEFKNCEVLETTEAFQLKILEQYMQSLTS